MQFNGREGRVGEFWKTIIRKKRRTVQLTEVRRENDSASLVGTFPAEPTRQFLPNRYGHN